MTVTIDDIIQQARSYNPASNEELLRGAYELALSAHGDQLRDSGEPYIVHPLAVAEILTSLQIDDKAIAAGLLHDVVEDTSVDKEVIAERFGADTLMLVEGVTKLSKLQFRNRHEAQAENLRRMLMAMSSDIRIILIKLADRLHNMRTISSHHSVLRQKEIAEETLTIYAPLAHRLGIFRIKSELEDLSIEVLEPERVAELKASLAQEQEERSRFVNEHIESIRKAVTESGIKCEITGRTKNYYSILRKMERQEKELSEIFDLNAIRIIVDTVRECYECLGIIHTMWKPIPGRFKDYIAMPKQNMYQSIHTTLIADNGVPFEVQIRTWDMHRIAEYGIAAHWRYKEGRSADADFDKKVEWLRNMLEWQQEVRDSSEFMETVRKDLFNENIYVFTPKGDVIELPSGSVPLDFAYRVHTQVGHSCVGARVNHRLVPLETELQNGDIVEVMTAKGHGPSRDWLKIVKTQQAKNRIRQWFRKEMREENEQLGRDAVDRECRRFNLEPAKVIKEDVMMEIAHRFGCTSIDDLYASIGANDVRVETVVTKLREEYKKEQPQEISIKAETNRPSDSGIIVDGIDSPMVRMAACCRPLPGEDIVGYVTRGRGISVHLADCPNVLRYRRTEPERLMPVQWGSNVEGLFSAEMEAICHDRDRLTVDIVNVMAETKTAVTGLKVNNDRRSGTRSIIIKVEVKSLDQFEYLMQRVSRIKGVASVHRMVRHRKGEE
ncbi:MAG: bifunctional (p)ppGpp synthetase/guanosine-3',5'-bis(diphosphate) 3'-pyrophosphohydrolase [Firmicutes bacterium]|nr:bifunctional (p)ppGpp synthetase/guanosine-3',5'-bis(diphosphate) 3'-pyrophosphohydrolase [Bacillota bacterium]